MDKYGLSMEIDRQRMKKNGTSPYHPLSHPDFSKGTVQPPPRHLAPRLHPAAPPPQSAAAGQMTTPRLTLGML